MPADSNSEITRLKKALNFLTSHLPGASELAEIAESETVTLESSHAEDAETILVGEQPNVSAAKKAQIGQVLYNRGIINAIYDTEAVRTAMGKYGNKALSGEQVRWGFENLDLTEARLGELGVAGFMSPIKISCSDHEGGGKVMFQQWTGKEWKLISGWVDTMQDVIRPMIEDAAAAYAKENKITPRSC